MHHLPSRYIPCDGRLTASAYFNPRFLHGERHDDEDVNSLWDSISIHAPRMGSDLAPVNLYPHSSQFQSTLPAWGATGKSGKVYSQNAISIHAPRMGSDIRDRALLCLSWISIHAPRMGSDGKNLLSFPYSRDFNPRSPHGERPDTPKDVIYLFNISIHAPRMGSDVIRVAKFIRKMQFQSTLPAWGATKHRINYTIIVKFQSTLPAWGATAVW